MNTSNPPHTAGAGKPYPKSFIDRIMDFIARLPVPFWLTYLVLFILQSAIFHVLVWIDGWQAAFTFNAMILIFPLWLWGPLAIMTYLDAISLEAISSFRPLLDIQEEDLERLRYEFTTMPAHIVLFSTLFWVIAYIIIMVAVRESLFVAYRFGTILTGVVLIEGLLSYAIGSVIYYHSIRQLRLVNRTVRLVKQFNLFHLEPVYAFSRVTSQTGIAWVLLLSLTLISFPIEIATLPLLVLLVIQVGLALAAFVLPLWIVNHRLVEEKRRLLAELNQRVETILASMHQRLDKNEWAQIGQLNVAMTGLQAEREVLDRIPTWPWRTGMLTGFLSAIVLPIVLFLLQLFLGNWLG